MTVFSKKNIELSKYEKVYFLQTRHFIIAEIGKPFSESWETREFTAPSKPLVAIGELQCDCVSTKDDRSNK